jgi:hypothetical protein
MALRKSTQVAQRVPAVAARDRSGAVHVFGEHTTVAGAFAAADVVEMIPFPAGTILTDLKIHFPDLDTATGVTLDVGVLTGQYGAALDDDGNARTCGTEFGSDLTTGQAGGSVLGTAAQMLAIAPSLKDRSIGFKIEAAPTTLIAGAKIRFAATFVPAPQGVAFA